MRLGVHVPIAGGLEAAVGWASRLSCTTMQIFSRSPRGGSSTPLPQDLIERFHAQRLAAGIDPLAVHGPYIINLASPDRAMWQRSVALYREEYQRAVKLQAQYLVTHVGSHKGSGFDAGIARVAEAVNKTLEGQPGTTMILLENTAGSGQGIGYQFEHLAAIRGQVEDKNRVGICLDTAHLFASGYAIHTAAGLAETIKSFDSTVGLKHLKLIHLNDSKAPFESRVDRHWHIGEGFIGREGFQRIVRHPAIQAVPWILETPKTTEREDEKNLNTVRELAGESAPGLKHLKKQAAKAR